MAACQAVRRSGGQGAVCVGGEGPSAQLMGHCTAAAALDARMDSSRPCRLLALSVQAIPARVPNERSYIQQPALHGVRPLSNLHHGRSPHKQHTQRCGAAVTPRILPCRRSGTADSRHVASHSWIQQVLGAAASPNTKRARSTGAKQTEAIPCRAGFYAPGCCPRSPEGRPDPRWAPWCHRRASAAGSCCRRAAAAGLARSEVAPDKPRRRVRRKGKRNVLP